MLRIGVLLVIPTSHLAAAAAAATGKVVFQGLLQSGSRAIYVLRTSLMLVKQYEGNLQAFEDEYERRFNKFFERNGNNNELKGDL